MSFTTKSSVYFILFCLIYLYTEGNAWEITSKNAVVTLVTGNTGYQAGALALGQSLVDVGSNLRRVVMVTPDVEKKTRKSLSKLWEIREVEPIACMHKVSASITPDKYDLQGAAYLKGLERWKNTCTKFAAWTLFEFERVVFIDADCLVIHPIDDVLFSFSNASFAAAPEVFPPDTFNSGFIVLNPGEEQFQRIMSANRRVGSAEGGDQGVFNNGVCPQWFNAPPDDSDCGRLPWLFNVEVAHYASYNTLREMSGQRLPSVLHFVSDGKPWTVLMFEYLSAEEQSQVARETRREVGKQAMAHMLWRRAFFKATEEKYPRTSFLLACADENENKGRQQESTQRVPGDALERGGHGRGRGQINPKSRTKAAAKAVMTPSSGSVGGRSSGKGKGKSKGKSKGSSAKPKTLKNKVKGSRKGKGKRSKRQLHAREHTEL